MSKSDASAGEHFPVGEFELINRLAAALGRGGGGGRSGGPGADVLIGIGDDAAAVRRDRLVDIYTTDTLVDGVHFRSGAIGWRDLGWKALAVNLSDVAAMGGTPVCSLVTLGVPNGTGPESLEELYRGMADASGEHGGQVIGGDVVRSPVLFITVAMVGTATRVGGQAVILRRAAAKPGDLVAVTGTLGNAAGGLRARESGRTNGMLRVLIGAQDRPEPRLVEGQALVQAGVRAAMDVSDGLMADLGKLCTASGVSATVHSDSLPVSDELRRAFPEDYLQLALGGGEDYELLLTAPPAVIEEALTAAVPAGVTVIGEVAEGPAQVRVLDADGRAVAVAHAGWDHLEA